MTPPRRYLEQLPNGKVALWCYLIWYLAVVAYHFDSDPRIWLNALGIAAIVGGGLVLSVAQPAAGGLDRWQTGRLLLIPFCVSSYSSLIKGKGFVLVFSPVATEVATATLSCAAFVAMVAAIKRARRLR